MGGVTGMLIRWHLLGLWCYVAWPSQVSALSHDVQKGSTFAPACCIWLQGYAEAQRCLQDGDGQGEEKWEAAAELAEKLGALQTRVLLLEVHIQLLWARKCLEIAAHHAGPSSWRPSRLSTFPVAFWARFTAAAET